MPRRPAATVGRRLVRDEGMTLIELTIAALIMVTVTVIFGTILFSVQRGLNQQTERSINNDQIRLAIEQIDREVRSGNLLYNPQLEEALIEGEPGGLPDFSLRVFSQSNAIQRCIQWAVIDRELRRRTWTDPDDKSPWRVVATGIVNRETSPPKLPYPAFSLAEGSAATGRTLDVVFYVNNSFDRSPEQTIRVEQSITGRNTTRATLANPCESAPS